MTIILASTSKYRIEQLQKLKVAFDCKAPNCDESLIKNELPNERAQRLALIKAQSIPRQTGDIVIGSDQVASSNDIILRKPKTKQNAINQLKKQRGQRTIFHTALAIVSDEGIYQYTDVTEVLFHQDLTDDFIERYIDADEPEFCAGAFKIESLGPYLFESVTTTDPSALVGLPLNKLANELRRMKLDKF